MMRPMNLYPIKDNYVIAFDYNTENIASTYPTFYDPWTEYLFEYLTDMLMSGQFGAVESLVINNRIAYIDSIVTDIYNETYSSALDDVNENYDSPGDMSSTAQSFFEYVRDNHDLIKYNMAFIANCIILTVYYPLNTFINKANASGIVFSGINVKVHPKTHTINATCTTNLASIKSHDPNWYDRISLLAPF